ncbi:hypothetical protein E2C01_024518 [Portunus trituberculatus]|uniref:Uncharacterized protein n=1 Tax=Portunus trituberculatus TaxID=210409 RepID=A0A5B7EEY7_PORTR|nr:hypothetical protein [Portunus trituberculatus]
MRSSTPAVIYHMLKATQKDIRVTGHSPLPSSSQPLPALNTGREEGGQREGASRAEEADGKKGQRMEEKEDWRGEKKGVGVEARSKDSSPNHQGARREKGREEREEESKERMNGSKDEKGEQQEEEEKN